jgi:hypothetical protein
MMNDFMPMLIVPALFALLHATGLILAVVYWRRCPSACALLLGASLLNLIVSASRIALQIGRGDFPFFGVAFTGLSILSWIAYGLMLMAVFAGRNEPTRLPPRIRRPDPEDDDWAPPAKAPAPTTDSTGIQEKP